MTSPSFGEIMYSAIVINIANFVLAIGQLCDPSTSWEESDDGRSDLWIGCSTVLLKLPLDGIKSTLT